MLQAMNRISAVLLTLFAALALLCVAVGYTRPPQPDEGALAHIFQLAVAASALVFVLFCATADWRTPERVVKLLVAPVSTLAAAFAGLYYLEHVWYR